MFFEYKRKRDYIEESIHKMVLDRIIKNVESIKLEKIFF